MADLGRIRLFYSYAHTDEAYRDALTDHLNELREDGTIGEWHDRLIVPSSDWNREIDARLSEAHIILLLVSPDFLRSEYSMSVEVKRAVELHFQNKTRIVPVIIRPAPEWKETVFGTFQALPTDAKPVSTWKRPEMGFMDVAQGIRSICKDIVDWSNPYRRANVGDWTEYEQTVTHGNQRETRVVRSLVIARSGNHVTLSITVYSSPPLTMNARIPLDGPVEDKSTEVFAQFGEQLPPNSQIAMEELGRGEQKLFVGGRPYYCRWTAARMNADFDEGRVVQDTKTWVCIDVPIDGLVRQEVSMRVEGGPTLPSTTKLLVGHGRKYVGMPRR